VSGKRIVFLDRERDYAVIVGHDGDLASLPVTVQNFEVRGRVVPFASLVKVTTRAAYYSEPLVPASYTFAEGQK
jgi:hypothetical protein